MRLRPVSYAVVVPVLDVPGVFAMLVPDGWTASQSGRTYELTRQGDNGAVHISMYERDGSPLGDDEAAGLISRFIGSVEPEWAGESRVLKESRKQHRAVAHFRAANDDGEFDWLAFVVLWPRTFLLCTATAQPGSPLPKEAETMFASIYPPRTGLLRRS